MSLKVIIILTLVSSIASFTARMMDKEFEEFKHRFHKRYNTAAEVG